MAYQHTPAPGRKGPFGANPVGGFVPKLTQKAFERHGFATAAIAMDWETIIGAATAAKCLPERIVWPRRTRGVADEAPEYEGDTPARSSGAATLHLAVEPAFALDVQYSAAQIIDRINAHFGYRAIGDMRIRQKPLATAGRIGPQRTQPTRAAVQGSSNSDKQAVATAVPDTVDNPNLAAALARLGASVSARTR